MDENKIKAADGSLITVNLSVGLQTLQMNNVISFCSMEYRKGYENYDSQQFYAPYYIEFLNGEGWLIFASNSIRNDRMNNQQWSSLHLKNISPNITRAYLVVPNDILLNEKEKKIAESYQKKITGNMFSAIEDVCYQSEILFLIEEHSHQLNATLPRKPIYKDNPTFTDIAAEPSFETLLIGCYRNDEHLRWILSNMLYNIRLNRRKGAIEQTYLVSKASRLLLYSQVSHQTYKYFNLTGKIERAGTERMIGLNYPNYQEGREYLLYHIGSELSSPLVQIDNLIGKYRPANWVQYAPVFVSYNGRIEDLERLG